MRGQIKDLNLRYIRVKGEDKQEIFVTKETIRIGTGQIAETDEYNLGVEFNMDIIIEVDRDINRITCMILDEAILEVT